MIFPKRSVIHEKRLFAVIGSIIAVTAILVSGGAATQLALAQQGQDIQGTGIGQVKCPSGPA